MTGASRGIGSEIALYYARAGASLALLSRTQAVLDKTKAHILEAVPKAQIITFVADVVDTQAIKAAVDGTVKTFSKIDIVVANAGKADPWKKRMFTSCSTSCDVMTYIICFSSAFTEYDPDNWWKTVEVNVRGVYNVAQYVYNPVFSTSPSLNMLLNLV